MKLLMKNTFLSGKTLGTANGKKPYFLSLFMIPQDKVSSSIQRKCRVYEEDIKIRKKQQNNPLFT